MNIPERLSFQILPNFHFNLSLDQDKTLLAEGQFELVSNGTNLLQSGFGPVDSSVPQSVETLFGPGWQKRFFTDLTVPGSGQVRLTLDVAQADLKPGVLFLEMEVQNLGVSPLAIDQLASPALSLGPALSGPLWTFQGAAVAWGQDFAFPLPETFRRDNFLGHIDHGEGGGIPLVCCWNREAGLALAHVEPQPRDEFMPVLCQPETGVRMALEDRRPLTLAPGECLRGPRVMLAAFQGDFFAPVDLYRQALAAQGIVPAMPGTEDYQPAWCSWGYEFDVRPDEILAALPKVKELGLRWLTLDDRWFDRYGDWNPRLDTFPDGEDEMRRMVNTIHQNDAYAQIWWYPLCVEDGQGKYDSHPYGISQILREHPDWLILNQNGSPARNNRGLAILDPSLPEVQDYLAHLTARFIQDWGFDGHKLDNIYTVPPCYNPAHHHHRPEESVEAFSEAYRIIFETTRRLKPYSVTQICPCGTPPTFSLLPYMDQAVTADPTSSTQIRQRIKFYKALLGPRAAVFADHVELSDEGVDFASEIGTGGIPATKFVWPPDPAVQTRVSEWWELSSAKEALYREWFTRYQDHPLAQGEYQNLYDLGFDVPETHSILLDQQHYYSFYTPRFGQHYRGPVELRGLAEETEYLLVDYVHQKTLGQVRGPNAVLDVDFESFLLAQAIPKN